MGPKTLEKLEVLETLTPEQRAAVADLVKAAVADEKEGWDNMEKMTGRGRALEYVAVDSLHMAICEALGVPRY